MRRREVITLLGGAAVFWPLAPRAQAAMPIVGYLGVSSAGESGYGMKVFRQTLREAGYVDGQNVAIEYRSADGRFDRFPSMATELVAARAAVIVAGALPAGYAATAATTTIPVIFSAGSDPATLDRLKGLIRPDGNIAIVSQPLLPLAAKRLEIIHALAPNAAAIAFLVDPDIGATHAQPEAAELSAAAQALGLQMVVVEARNKDELIAAFATATHQRVDALIVDPHPFFIAERPQIVALARALAAPVIYPFTEDAEAGGLVSYGNSNFDIFRQMGLYAARILKGDKPGDLPVGQPAKIALTINLKTAGQLGLTVPQTLLARADKLIE